MKISKDLNIFQWRSLKTRVTLFTLAIFLLSMWSLAFYASRILREDMQRLLGDQQFSAVSVIAAEVNQELGDRLTALGRVAARVDPATLANRTILQTVLEEHVILQSLFSGGVIAYQLDGTAIAEVPLSAGRMGVNFMDQDYLLAALKEGKAAIGRPVMDGKMLIPVLPMAVPIRDHQGTVIGALAGLINLGMPRFLGKITENRYGKTGGYSLIARQHRLIVTSTDKSRIMSELPDAGVNPAIDRAIQGFEGSAIYVSSVGVERIASIKGVPLADWFLVASMATEEAFAPIHAMQRHMLLATVILTLLASALTWLMLRRQLAPLLAAAETLATLSATHEPVQLLPVARQDEIGELIGGFNRLLADLGQRKALLRQILDTSSVAIFLVDMAGRITQANQRMAEMFGCSIETLERSEYVALVHPVERETGRQKMLALLASTIPSVDLDRLYLRADHTEFWGHLTGRRFFDANGEKCGLVGVIADITERKQAEAALRESEQRYRTLVEWSPEPIIVHSGGKLTYANPAAINMFGARSPQDLIGKPILDLVHPDFHQIVLERAKNVTDRAINLPMIEEKLLKLDGTAFVAEVQSTSINYEGKLSSHVSMRDITERKAAEDRIQSLAFSDPLTGLPNRRLLLDRLKHALAASSHHQRQGALLLVDLDDFKTLNDTRGHDKGDLLLQQVAKRLTSCIREGDTVARLGGDEFVVLLEHLSENAQEAATQAEAVAGKILVTLNQPYQLGSSESHSTSSIGITLFDSAQQVRIEEPLKRAELALYQAKAAGRNTLRFFDPHMQAVVTTRAALEAGLREGVLKDQFILYYQAQVTGERQITGVEALLRWQDPRRGMVSPAEFIPMAEETGLILPLGQWVLETACTQLTRWASRPEMAHLTVAVNVSARQFHQPGFVDQVLVVLKRTGANPQRLKLELTESFLVANVEDVIAKMSALKSIGVGFSLDDFGTGFSSLSYLKRLPLDQLKIDQGFVRDILLDANDAAIAKMVVALADSLGLAVIAEGVETEAQRDFLARLGCHACQGDLFSRPLPLKEFEVFAVRGSTS